MNSDVKSKTVVSCRYRVKSLLTAMRVPELDAERQQRIIREALGKADAPPTVAFDVSNLRERLQPPQPRASWLRGIARQARAEAAQRRPFSRLVGSLPLYGLRYQLGRSLAGKLAIAALAVSTIALATTMLLPQPSQQPVQSHLAADESGGQQLEYLSWLAGLDFTQQRQEVALNWE